MSTPIELNGYHSDIFLEEVTISKKQKKKKLKRQQEIRPQQNLQLKTITPLTANQKLAFDNYQNKNLFLYGTAGTGKTYCALYLALNHLLNSTNIHKIYLVRSAVASRNIGFLPGSIKEKQKVYEDPYRAICSDLFNRGDAYDILKNKGSIEFLLTSYIRGITLDNCIIIVDETQNLSAHESDTIITRMGNNCKIIFCGDGKQSDFTNEHEKGGVSEFIRVIKKVKSFSFIQFGINDIVRGETVKQYIIAKENLGVNY